MYIINHIGLKVSILFLLSPRLCRTQRAVEDVHSITLEIETADHNTPLLDTRQPFTS